MTEEEVKRVLHTLRLNYPQSYSGYTAQDSAELVRLWTIEFKNDPAQEVFQAVQNYISGSTERFAPNIGMIKRMMAEAKAPKFDEAALWGEIKHYMQNMYGEYEIDKQRYAELSEPIRKCYTYGDLKGMSQRASLDNDSYERPRFAKYLNNYRAEDISNRIAMKEKERAMITHE